MIGIRFLKLRRILSGVNKYYCEYNVWEILKKCILMNDGHKIGK